MPASQPCSVPGCPYKTPEGIPNWDLLTQQLEVHQKSVHLGPANTGEPMLQILDHKKLPRRPTLPTPIRYPRSHGDSSYTSGPGTSGKRALSTKSCLTSSGTAWRMTWDSWPSLRGEPPTSLQKQTWPRELRAWLWFPSTPQFMLSTSTKWGKNQMKMFMHSLPGCAVLRHPVASRKNAPVANL